MIAAVVVAANAPYLFGPFDPNPALVTSGIAEHVTSGALPGLPTIDPNYGWVAQALGKRAVLDWIHGQVPWWNPFEGVGMPLAGNMQSAAMFPLVFFMLLQNGVFFSHLVLEVASGAATYALLRRLGVSTVTACGCGGAFALNGTYAWLSIAPVNVIVSLPLILLAIEMARSSVTTERSGGWFLLAIGTALSIYGGFPETAAIDGLLAVLWLLARTPGLSWTSLRALATKIALGVLSGFLLGAPILVAFLDDLHHGYVGIHGSSSLAHLSLPSVGSVQIAFPYFLGPISGFDKNDPTGTLPAVWGNVGGYLGMALIVLAAAGLIGSLYRPHRALRGVLAVWSLVALARTYGAGWAVSLLSIVPGLDRIAFYRYSSVSVEMALLVLAALGIDDLVATTGGERLTIACGALALAVVTGLVLLGEADPLTKHMSGALHAHLWQDWSAVWGFGLLALFGLAALALPGSSRRVGLSGLLLLDATALFVVPQLSAPRGGTIDNAAVAYLRSHVGSHRIYSVDLILQANYGSYFGVAELDTNDLPIPNPWRSFVQTKLDTGADPITFDGDLRDFTGAPSAVDELVSHLPAFRAAGVALVLAPSGVSLPSPLKPAWSDSLVSIYRLPGAAPVFSAAGCSVRELGIDEVRLSCARPSTLIRRELDEPGWHATVSGRAGTVAAYDGVFQSVAVPAGTYMAKFHFEPPHEVAGWSACAVGLLVLVAGLFVESRPWLGRRKGS